jgi:hypothetical protein
MPSEQFIFAYVVIGLTIAGLVLMVIYKVALYFEERRAGVEYRWEPPPPREVGPFRRWMERHAKDAEARYTPRRYVTMSSDAREEAVRDEFQPSSEDDLPSSPDPVPAHQSQLEPDFPSVREPERDPASLRKLTRAEEIALLTVQRNDDGSYRHSANKIADLMGGTAADVKAQVAAIRGPAKPAQSPPTGRVARPADGWKKPA